MRLIIDFRTQYGKEIQEVTRTLESKVRLILDTAVSAREATSGGEEIIDPECGIEAFMGCLSSHIRELLDRPIVIDSGNITSADILAECIINSYLTLQREVDQSLQMVVLERFSNNDGKYSTAIPIQLTDLLEGVAWQEIHIAIKEAGAQHGEVCRGVVEGFINTLKGA